MEYPPSYEELLEALAPFMNHIRAMEELSRKMNLQSNWHDCTELPFDECIKKLKKPGWFEKSVELEKYSKSDDPTDAVKWVKKEHAAALAALVNGSPPISLTGTPPTPLSRKAVELLNFLKVATSPQTYDDMETQLGWSRGTIRRYTKELSFAGSIRRMPGGGFAAILK